MPKEKTLFFIGIWIIILSNFIGLPTEIKNYLFIATAIILIMMSYVSSFSKLSDGENFFHKKSTTEKTEKSVEVKKEEKKVYRPISFTSLKREEKVVEPESTISIPDLSNPFGDSTKSSYEPIIKVRKARVKPRPKQVEEEIPIKSNFNLNSEEEDVIVISSDEDESRN